MGYALAHDENGVPLDVPTSASGWLVRKHSGGRGRPAAVYDGEGRPLVVPLDATLAELRECGCKPAMYRLDAVDGGRKPMGITAYTEVIAGSGDPVEAALGGAQDAAVAALARAVEAMQRVQAERERVQAEMFMRLIERLAPAPAQPANDLAAMVRQLADTQAALGEMAEARAPRNAEAAEDEDGPESVWEQPGVAQTAEVVVKAGLPMLSQWLWKKMGLTESEMGAMAAASGQPAPKAESPAATSDGTPAEPAAKSASTEAAPDEAAASAEAKKLALVFEQLTPDEERRTKLAVQMLTPDVLKVMQDKLLAMDPAQAAEFLRSLDRKFGGGASVPTKEAA